jgi:hypothetical protein
MGRAAGSYGKTGMGPKKGLGSSKRKPKAGPPKPKKKVMTFGQTFAKNRKEGKATFMYKGKKYSTKTKEEVSKKATRKTVRTKKKAVRKATKLGSGVGLRTRMKARRAARVQARKTRRANRALRRKS